MSYRVIYLDGRKIEGKGRLPEIGCDVCRDIERNVIEPVAIFVKEEKVEEISKRFVHTMENVLVLDVPLECSVSVGDSWGELK